MSEIYADIVVPVAQGAFTFRVGDSLKDIALLMGNFVKVQLQNKLYVGIIWRIHTEKPPFKTIKSVDSLIEKSPLLSEKQMRLWEWIADYYMCTLGEVMRAALPSAMKPSGFSDAEFDSDTYRPPTITYISLNKAIESQAGLDAAFESLKRSKRQYEALISFVEATGEQGVFTKEIPRDIINADMTVLRVLQKKNILNVTVRESKPGELPPLPSLLPKLSKAQKETFLSIKQLFDKKDVVLLKGVTGSGKTEIYIKFINEELAKDRNVLYLLPEIAMTSQLIERIRRYFGERVVTYHSAFTERNRVESYRKMSGVGGGLVILGTRSSLFLPMGDLGLVIVDEEHDGSYKQADPAPRYNARDSAIVLAGLYGAKTLLGSATPSLESYANALWGKYGLSELHERYGGIPLPRILISDTLTAVKRGERTSHFNKLLLDRIGEALAAHEQVMLFQNRRGFSPYVECGECGWIASCPNCNVTLTLHKGDGKLKCHYCGYTKSVPHTCPACGLKSLDPKGFGTEKVEEELAKLFPDARIERLDRDTSNTVRKYNAIVRDFESRKIDILVGTQMITKGFDFDGVSLVGILNADNLLAYPDFRSSERAFQLMMQVAGRAGRRSRQGEVIIQTSQPDNALIRQVATYDYEAMARGQLAERSAFIYPPYARLVLITLKHRDKQLLWQAANFLGDTARPIFGLRLLGPQPPAIDRIKREYLLNFILKVERGKSFEQAKTLLADAISTMHSKPDFRNITVVCNVDPH